MSLLVGDWNTTAPKRPLVLFIQLIFCSSCLKYRWIRKKKKRRETFILPSVLMAYIQYTCRYPYPQNVPLDPPMWTMQYISKPWVDGWWISFHYSDIQKRSSGHYYIYQFKRISCKRETWSKFSLMERLLEITWNQFKWKFYCIKCFLLIKKTRLAWNYKSVVLRPRLNWVVSHTW